MPSESLGCATITHPYHPLRGQRFPIIKTRHLSNQEMFILQGSDHGTFALPREWTDQALPSVISSLDTPLKLDVTSLLILQKNLQQLKEKASSDMNEQSQKT